MTKDLKRQLSSLFSDMQEPEVEAEQKQVKKGKARPSRRSQPPRQALPEAEETLTKRVQRLRTAAEMSRAATSILDMDELLPKAVELVREGFDLYYAGLFLVDETGQWAVLRAGTGEAGRQMLTASHKLEVGGASMIGWCIANAQARIALDVGKEAVRFDNPLLPQTRSEMALPLISRGHIIGATTFQSDQPAAFADEDITILQTMADQLANAIENTRLLEDTKSRLAQLTALQETTRAVASTLELDKLLNLITQQATTLLQGTGGIINLVDWEKNEDEVVTAGGSSAHTVGFRSPLENSLSGWVTLHNQPVISNQLQNDNRVDVYVRSGEIRERNAAIAPLVIKDQVIGTLVVMNKQGGEGAFNQADLDLLVAFANQAAIAIQNARLFTETKRAEEALRISQERFALAVRGTNDGLWDWDIKGQSLYWSPRLKELLGYADHELTVDFETFNRLLHPDDQERVTAALEAHLKDRVPYDVEERQLHKSGEYRWLRARGQALWDENGNPVRMVGFSTDITERKRTEEALQASEEKYRTILENIQEGYFEVDIAGNFTFFNDALVRILGYPRDELMGMNNREYMDDKNARAVYQAFNAIYRTREPSQAVGYEILRRDGTRRSVEVSASLITDLTGEPIGFRGVMRDITERKQAEEMLERRAMQLQTAAQVSHAATSILEVDELLPQVVELVRDHFGLYYVGLFLVDEASQSAVLRAGTGEAGHKLLQAGHKLEVSGSSMIGWCVAHRQSRIALDVGDEAVRFSNPLLPNTRSEMALPLISRERVIGAMTIQSEQPAAFSQEDVTILQTMADQLANAIQNARLLEQEQTRAQELTVLNEMSRALSAELELDAVLRNVYQYTSRLMDATNLYIALYDAELDEISFPLYAEGEPVRSLAGRRRTGRGLTEYVIQTCAPLLISENVPARLQELGIESIGQEAQSWLGVPMTIGEQVVGVIAVQSYTTPRVYNERHRDLLHVTANQAAIAVQNARLFQQMQASEARFRDVALASADWVWEVDAQGHYTYCSDRVADVLGYQPDEMLGKTPFDFMSPDEAARVGTTFGELVAARKPLVDLENRNLTKDGREIVLLTNGVPVLDQAETLLGYRGVDKDITERKQAEAELERSNEELSILNSITSAVSSSLDLDHILQGALTNVLSLTGFKAGLVSLLNPAMGRLELVVQRNLPEALVQRLRTGLEGTLCQLVYDRREPVSLRDLSQDPPLDTGGLLKLGLRSYLGVPLESKGQVVGTLCVFGYAPHSVSDTTQASMQAIAQQIGVAVDNARLFEEARTRAVEMAALNDLSRVLTAQLNLSQVLEEVYRGVSRLLDTTNFYIALYDPDKHEVSFPINVTESVIDRQISTMSADRGLTGHILRTRQSLLIKDDVEEWIDKMGMEYVGEPARSWLGVPLMIGDQMLGVMAIQSFRSPRAFNEQDRDILMAISSQAAIAIQNARLFEESKRRITELSILNDVSQALSSALRLDELLEIVYQQVGRVFDTTNFYIATHEEESDEWMMAFHMADGQRRPSELRRVETGRTSHIIRTRQPLVLNTAQASIDFSASHGIRRSDDPTKSWMGVPLITGGKLVGVMAIHSSDRENLYSDQDLALFSTIGAQVAVAIQNARLFEQTRAALTEAQALYEASRRIESASDLQEMVVALAEGFPVSGVEWAALLTFERDETGEVQAVQVQGNWQSSQDIVPLPIGTRFSKEMFASLGLMLNTTPVFSDDTQTDERVDPAMVRALQQRNIRAAVVLPLGVGRNQSGVLMLASSQAHRFVEREIRGYVTLSGQMAVVVENRRLLQEAEARARREQVLREITARVRGSTDAETIVRTAVRELGLALGRPAFIRLGSAEQLAQAPATQSANGNGAEPPVRHSSDYETQSG